MNVLFAAGGTGGHLYPAIALADALAPRARIRFVGTVDRLETAIVPAAGYELETISARSLRRTLSPAALQTIGANALGIAQAMRLLRGFSADAVVATGGYVCFPVMAAAKLLRGRAKRPALALLEPNARPGLTNRLLAPLVDEVWGAFDAPDSRFASKFVKTGIPVRSSLFRPAERTQAALRLGLDPSRRTILAMGGSQGARSINAAVSALVSRRALPSDWQILHVSGERNYAQVRAQEREPFGGNRVTLVPYVHDMADAYALADVAIARSGASTLGELAALGVPSILVPYPFASDDHQAHNARAFETAGACAVIEDRDLDGDALWWSLRAIMQPERLSAMSSAARSLAPGDPVATIVARIDALVSRKAVKT